MIHCVVAVFDSAALAFGKPVFVPSKGVAVRSFIDEVNNSAADNMLHKYSDDFTLFQVAYFDDESGVFTPVMPHEQLFRGKDVATTFSAKPSGVSEDVRSEVVR